MEFLNTETTCKRCRDTRRRRLSQESSCDQVYLNIMVNPFGSVALGYIVDLLFVQCNDSILLFID